MQQYNNPSPQVRQFPSSYPVIDEIVTIGEARLKWAQNFVVKTDADYRELFEAAQFSKGRIKAAEKELADPISAANKLHKWVTGLKSRATSFYNAIVDIADQKCGDYQTKKENELRVKQARIDAVAKADQQKAALKQATVLDEGGDPQAADSAGRIAKENHRRNDRQADR